MEELRKSVSETDAEIIALVARRMRLAELIGEEKTAGGLAVRDREREEKVAERYREEASKLGLDPDFAEKLCKILIEEAVKVQERQRLRCCEGTYPRLPPFGAVRLRFVGRESPVFRNDSKCRCIRR